MALEDSSTAPHTADQLADILNAYQDFRSRYPLPAGWREDTSNLEKAASGEVAYPKIVLINSDAPNDQIVEVTLVNSLWTDVYIFDDSGEPYDRRKVNQITTDLLGRGLVPGEMNDLRPLKATTCKTECS